MAIFWFNPNLVVLSQSPSMSLFHIHFHSLSPSIKLCFSFYDFQFTRSHISFTPYSLLNAVVNSSALCWALHYSSTYTQSLTLDSAQHSMVVTLELLSLICHWSRAFKLIANALLATATDTAETWLCTTALHFTITGATLPVVGGHIFQGSQIALLPGDVNNNYKRTPRKSSSGIIIIIGGRLSFGFTSSLN